MEGVQVSVVGWAEKAYRIGLQPWAVRHDGSKAPRGDGWSPAEMPERLSLEDTLRMFKADDTGWGWLTGSRSKNLELFEFEARFVHSEGFEVFCSMVEDDEDLSEVFARLRSSFEVATPSGGIHLPFFVDGDPLPNTKLASRPALPEELELNPNERMKVLIETRGEGGFMIAAGTNGTVHPTHGGWVLRSGKINTIPTLSVAERDALYDLARMFDEMPERAPSVPKSNGGPGLGLDSFGDGMEELHGYVREVVGLDTLLAEDGWQSKRQKPGYDSVLYRRPGKNFGHSAELFADGMLAVYTSTVDEVWERTLLEGPSCRYATPIGVLAAVRFDGDVGEAMRWTRSQINATRKQTPPPSEGLNLHPEFWDQRPFLQACRDAAHAGLASPDAVLASCLPRLAAMVPPSVKLPAIVGSQATLDYMACVVAASSGGKTISNGIAARLLPIREDGVLLMDQSPGSGEGLISAFMDWERDDKGKKIGDPSYKHSKVRAIHLTADEGSGLHEQATRSGTTIMQTLCSAWSGSGLGQLNASIETKRLVPKGKRRVSATINIQTFAAHTLLDWAPVGLPQRLLYAWAHSPLPDEDIEEPDPWVITTIPMQDMPAEFDVADEIRAEIRACRRSQASGQAIEHKLDGHLNLLRLKTAALLAFAESRRNVTVEDWQLAGEIVAVSCRVRDHVAQVAAAEETAKAQAIGRRQAVIDSTKAEQLEVDELKKIDALATKIGTVVSERGGMGKGRLRSTVCSATTQHRFDSALEMAVERGLVTVEEGHRGGERIDPA